MLLQASEEIAKKYGGNKQKIAQAVQSGLLGATEAVLAGMFIDRVRAAAALEQVPEQTIAEQTFAPKAPPTAVSQMQLAQQGMPPQGMPPQGMPPQGIGGTPQAAQMQAMQQQMAPRPSVAGMNQIPVNPNIIPSAASGGLVAFAGGGEIQGYAGGGGTSDNPLYGETQEKRSRLEEEQANIQRALPPLVRRKELGLSSPALDATQARLTEVQKMLAGLPKELAQSLITQNALPAQSYSTPIDTSAGAPRNDYVSVDGQGGDLNAVPLEAEQEVTPAAEDYVDFRNVDSGLGATAEARNGVFSGPNMPRAMTSSNPEFYALENSDVPEVTAEDREREEFRRILAGNIAKPEEKVVDDAVVVPNAAEEAKAKRDAREIDDVTGLPTSFMKGIKTKFADSSNSLSASSEEINKIANDGLGENENAALNFYKGAEERAKTAQNKELGSAMLDLGLGMMATKEPTLLGATGVAAEKTVEKYRSRMKEHTEARQKAFDKRATFDVVRNDRKIKNLTLALDKFQGEEKNKIQKEIVSLTENNSAIKSGMDREARNEMELLGLLSSKENNEAQRSWDKTNNEAERYTRTNLASLDLYSKGMENDKDRKMQYNLQEKRHVWESSKQQLEFAFQGEENRLRRDHALKIVELQVNAPTDADKQIGRFQKYLMEQDPKLGETKAGDIAQRAYYDAQASVVNAAKFEAISADVIMHSYKDANIVWDTIKFADKKGQTKQQFVNDYVQNAIQTMRANTAIFGRGTGAGGGGEGGNQIEDYWSLD
jgi:hypothetical protein